jgi:hypothetical protein
MRTRESTSTDGCHYEKSEDAFFVYPVKQVETFDEVLRKWEITEKTNMPRIEASVFYGLSKSLLVNMLFTRTGYDELMRPKSILILMPVSFEILVGRHEYLSFVQGTIIHHNLAQGVTQSVSISQLQSKGDEFVKITKGEQRIISQEEAQTLLKDKKSMTLRDVFTETPDGNFEICVFSAKM